MNRDLIHRLSRIQGQIEAIKKNLDQDSSTIESCLNNVQLLKASVNGLKKFGAAYMTKKIKNCINEPAATKKLEEALLLAVDTGFDL